MDVRVDGGVTDCTKIVAGGLEVMSCKDIFFWLCFTGRRYGVLLWRWVIRVVKEEGV